MSEGLLGVLAQDPGAAMLVVGILLWAEKRNNWPMTSAMALVVLAMFVALVAPVHERYSNWRAR